MKKIKSLNLLLLFLAGMTQACSQTSDQRLHSFVTNDTAMKYQVTRTDDEWRQVLTPVQFRILREKVTERAFTGEYDEFFERGAYYCAGCGQKLFESDTKFNSGCGWPAFFAPYLEDNVHIQIDRSHGMVRSEVLCASCGGHLGHVFDDGPPPTGLRYCINSGALVFKPDTLLGQPEKR